MYLEQFYPHFTSQSMFPHGFPCALQCYFSLSSRPHKGGTSHRRKGAFHFTLTRSPLSSPSRWGLLSLPTVGGNKKNKKKKRNSGLYQSQNNMNRSHLWAQYKAANKIALISWESYPCCESWHHHFISSSTSLTLRNGIEREVEHHLHFQGKHKGCTVLHFGVVKLQ